MAEDFTLVGWFGRRQRAAASDVAPVASDGKRGKDAGLEEAGEVLWRLTRLPREEFELTYGDLLGRTWRYLERTDGGEWARLRRELIGHVEAALRVRQARIIPRAAAAEDAARLGEVLTFALAVAVVADRVGRVVGRSYRRGWCPWRSAVPADVELHAAAVPPAYGALVLGGLVGEKGRAWLGQEPVALRAVAAYFGGAGSELREIADEAARRVGVVAGVGDGTAVAGRIETTDTRAGIEAEGAAPVQPEEGSPVAAEGAQQEAKTETAPAPAQAERGGGPPLESAAGREDAGKPPPALPASAEDVTSFPRQQDAPEEVGTGAAGWMWVNWVRRGVWDGSLKVNVPDGWLFNVEGKAFVAAPQGFEAFAAARGEELTGKGVRNRVARLREQELHRGANGKWVDSWRARMADGSVREGMLFPGELLWDRSPPPASPATLRRGRGGS